ncbi:MAG: hypothetical protein OCD76_22475 [Reichenbachiella sp.]
MKKNLSITLIFDHELVLNTLSFLDIGHDKTYLNQEQSKEQFRIAYQRFIKKELTDLVETTSSLTVPVSAFFSGTFLDLLLLEDPEMINHLRVASKKNLELLTGSYNNTLSAAFSIQSYLEEVKEHQQLLAKLFDYEANKLYIAENIYYNDLAKMLVKNGLTCTFAGAIDWYLGGEINNRILNSQSTKEFNVLLVDGDFGQAIFDNLEQTIHFLQLDITALKKLGGIKSTIAKAQVKTEILNLSQQIKLAKPKKSYSIKSPVMGSQYEVSLEAIYSNALQSSALKHYYSLRKTAIKSKQSVLGETWKQLGHSQYFFNMDKAHDEHAYDYYSNYMNILTDLEIRLGN